MIVWSSLVRLSVIHSSYQVTPFHPTIMIYFQTKPDNVFDTIVQEALISESVEIKILADDGAIESWEGLYPESSQRLEPYSAVRIMHQLLAACRDAMVYRLSDDHWLVLYECVKNFCSSHNDLLEDQGNGVRLIGKYKIGLLDDEGIVNIYFWDTDFLLQSRLDPWEYWPDKQEEDHDEENHDDESLCVAESEAVLSALEMVEEVAWSIPEEEAFFRTGSTQYPDSV